MMTVVAVAIAWIVAIAAVLALLAAAHRLSNAEGQAEAPADEGEAGDSPGVS